MNESKRVFFLTGAHRIGPKGNPERAKSAKYTKATKCCCAFRWS